MEDNHEEITVTAFQAKDGAKPNGDRKVKQ
jgi:hypothetical protein